MQMVSWAIWGVLSASACAWGEADIDAALRLSLHGEAQVDSVSGPVVRIGDVDGDEVDDFAVGMALLDSLGPGPLEWSSHFGIALVSSATLEVVRRLDGPTGYSGTIAGVHDVDGDGLDDLAFGLSAYGGDGGANRVVIRSSASGAQLREFPIPGLFIHPDGFTTSTRDGRRRLLVGSADKLDEPYQYHGGHGGWFWPGMRAHGRLDVWPVDESHSQVTIPGPKSFGEHAAWLDDIDGDGVADIGVLGHTAHDQPSWVEVGSKSAIAANTIEAWSGATGEPLWSLNVPWTFWLFGRVLRAVGDVDQDGHSDLALGLPMHDTACEDAGRVVLISGRSGDVLRIQDGWEANFDFGEDLCALPDIDGDGVDDYAVCAPRLDHRGPLDRQNQPGEILLYAGRNGRLLGRITLPDARCGLGVDVAAVEVSATRTILAATNIGRDLWSRDNTAHFYEITTPSDR